MGPDRAEAPTQLHWDGWVSVPLRMSDLAAILERPLEVIRQLPSLLTVIERVDRAAAIPALTVGVMFGACLAASVSADPQAGDDESGE